MKIVSTAPGRCGVVGNPTDMYGGSVISCSTAERAKCVIDNERVDSITISAGDQTQTVRVNDDLERRGDHLDLARVALKELGVLNAGVRPFSLATSTQIPMQAGLAGSTAMLAAIVGALLTVIDRRLCAHETAELVRKIEYESMGVVCGFQDAYMTVFGGVNYMDFRGKNSFDTPETEKPLATVEPLSSQLPTHLPIVLAHTGVKHHSGTVHSSPRERWRAGERAFVDGYAEVADLARSGKRAILRREWARLGELINRNHAIVRDLGGSGEANEKLIAAALDGGALGAKLAGAGGGGTILALTLDMDKTIELLLAAGADAILKPQPSAGLTVEIE
jgi:galactokinase/mevalonate kinase-like predicted kinase